MPPDLYAKYKTKITGEFQFFYFNMSRLIQCVSCHFFVMNCEIYYQFLSENCFYIICLVF